MSDETEITSETYSELQQEISKQLAEVKAAFQAELDELKKANDQLTSDNRELQRQLVRSSIYTPQAPEPEKTEEQIYAERIQHLSARTIEIMKEI